MEKLPRGSAKRGFEYAPPGKTKSSGVSKGAQFSGVDALDRGAGSATTFAGRSCLIGGGKAPSVDLGVSVASGNRRTAIAAHGAANGDGPIFGGHGFLTNK
jgi:hypothetical protein